MSKPYSVKIPIAGHAFVEVEADSEEEAIEKAIEEATISHVEEWEAIKQFNQGNVCYCPRPWVAEAECLEDEDDE
jgi:hypothetical protein